MVVKVDLLQLHSELGVIGGREPRWAIARKFAPEVAETRLLHIKVNVGRTGALNPYAELEPVQIGGVTVTSATLHNEELIATKDIREGDRVRGQPGRRGDPPDRPARSSSRASSGGPFRMPDQCPRCGTPVERPEGEAMRYCPNVSCPGRVLEGIVHFASRDAMDIRGLGYERVRQLLDTKLIENVADLYDVTADQLIELDRFATQSAEQLVAAIAASKERPLSSLLFALGIRHVGKTVAVLLARRFGSMAALMEAAEAGIAGVQGVGPTIAEAVSGFFAEPRNRLLVERLEKAGLTLTEPRAAGGSGSLEGQAFVITGTLPNLSRAAPPS